MIDRDTSTQALPHYLNEWVARQRWFASKGAVPALHSLGAWSLATTVPGVRIRTYLVFDASVAGAAASTLASESPVGPNSEDGQASVPFSETPQAEPSSVEAPPVSGTRSLNPGSVIGATLYQLPLTERLSPLPGGEAALIALTGTRATAGDIISADIRVAGASGTSSSRTPSQNAGQYTERYVYDAPHDPAYAEALLLLILRGEESPVEGNAQADAHGHAEPGATAQSVVTSRVLRGEQSNTSIIFDVLDAAGHVAPPVICKVFRALCPGENPDVAVQTALARAGSRLVPRPIGSVNGHWVEAVATPETVAPVETSFAVNTARAVTAAWHPDRVGEVEPQSVQGHLACAQEFLPGVEDAWRTALTAVRTDTDFTAQSRSLGVATARVHGDLARVLPSMAATPEVRAAAIAGMRRRYQAAAKEVPQLAECAASAERVFNRAATAQWPALQRIHGDYHLGQVLNVPGRGWALVDFEGEPLKPLSERVRPDVPTRDVAGMLRSFAYAASTIAMDFPAHDQAAIERWASACRAAFLAGYASESGQDLHAQAALLDAFELDKAVYETVYETRNRPAWLEIPLAAVRAMTSRPTEQGHE